MSTSPGDDPATTSIRLPGKRPVAAPLVLTAAIPLAVLAAADGLHAREALAAVIVFLAASVSSIAGFAFSPLAGSMLVHVTDDSVHAVEIMLVASIVIQAYSVWVLRASIVIRELVPYFAGGILAILPGVYLLLNTPRQVYLLALGAFLTVYSVYMLLKPKHRLKGNYLIGRVVAGALGGITGATAAFPGAFVTIWCNVQGWDREHQRAIYQPYILGMQVVTLVALSALKPVHAASNDLAWYVLPSVLGAYIGLNIFNRLTTGQFNRIVSAFLLLSGIALMAKLHE
ncbi:MAG: sulfite exporter TauE/SafE family protein [Hyphomicrobiaceae bacterium]